MDRLILIAALAALCAGCQEQTAGADPWVENDVRAIRYEKDRVTCWYVKSTYDSAPAISCLRDEQEPSA